MYAVISREKPSFRRERWYECLEPGKTTGFCVTAGVMALSPVLSTATEKFD